VGKQYRTLVPDELIVAVDSEARAFAAGDAPAAEKSVCASVLIHYRQIWMETDRIRPIIRFELLARARLAFQYLMKIRFHGPREESVTLQSRWRLDYEGSWRIVEIEDVSARSPWKKPDIAAGGTNQ